MRRELRDKAVLYLNSDESGRGFIMPGGSDSLQRLLNEVAAAVIDPETGVSVQARLRARTLANGLGAILDGDARFAVEAAAAGGDLPLQSLGAGSDFVPFAHHLGISTLSVEYGGEADQQGVYHSRYDTFDHYVRFGDPAFKYSVLLAQTNGRLVLRMADAQLLPQQGGSLAQRIDAYVRQLHALLEARRRHAAEVERLLRLRVFELASDPQRPLLPPPAEGPVPNVNLMPLDDAVMRLTQVARAFDAAYAAQLAAPGGISNDRARRINALLRGLDQAMTDPRGLPGRSWYTNLIVAPALSNGYAGKTLPGGARRSNRDNGRPPRSMRDAPRRF